MDVSHLQSLGSEGTAYKFDGPDAGLLERFDNPLLDMPEGSVGTVRIEAPEFTSLCPKTGQPDFARIVIVYRPRLYCVESKSLKLYLTSFRNVGEFHESCIARMARDLHQLLDPDYMEIEGQFTPRGGIPFWPKVRFVRPLGRTRAPAPPQPDEPASKAEFGY